MRILIVDDSVVERRVMHGLLANYGDTDDATNGAECLQLIAQSYEDRDPFRILFLDLSLPDMTGLDILDRIRHDEAVRQCPIGQHLRVVLVTSHSEPENVLAAHQRHCDGFLVKPIRPPRLAVCLSSLGFPPLAAATGTPAETQ